ncbi:unnamed protein product, partial [Pleuronectes platessa]
DCAFVARGRVRGVCGEGRTTCECSSKCHVLLMEHRTGVERREHRAAAAQSPIKARLGGRCAADEVGDVTWAPRLRFCSVSHGLETLPKVQKSGTRKQANERKRPRSD